MSDTSSLSPYCASSMKFGAAMLNATASPTRQWRYFGEEQQTSSRSHDQTALSKQTAAQRHGAQKVFAPCPPLSVCLSVCLPLSLSLCLSLAYDAVVVGEVVLLLLLPFLVHVAGHGPHPAVRPAAARNDRHASWNGGQGRVDGQGRWQGRCRGKDSSCRLLFASKA